MPYGAITMRKRAGRERQRADVAADQRSDWRDAPARADGLRRARASSIGADRSMPTRSTPARASGSETRPVPQPSSSTGPSRLRGDAAPERDVATAERLRVLPVVERRVLVPALPAFAFHWRVL